MLAWNRFKLFLVSTLGTSHTPATSHQVALYTAHLHYSHLKVSTIKCHLSAIGFMHEADGYPNPTKSFIIQKLLTAYAKSDTKPQTRRPITISILQKIVHSVQTHTPNRYKRRLFTALFTSMYHAALRISEVCKTDKSNHTLHHSQINLQTKHKTQTLQISFRSFKHSSKTTPKLVLATTKSTTCPVKAYSKFLKVRPNISGPAFCQKSGSPLKRPQVAQSLKHYLALSGYNPKYFNTHSFRIGKTTDLAKQGYSHPNIALIGRWKSNAYLTYIKPTSIHTN